MAAGPLLTITAFPCVYMHHVGYMIKSLVARSTVSSSSPVTTPVSVIAVRIALKGSAALVISPVQHLFTTSLRYFASSLSLSCRKLRDRATKVLVDLEGHCLGVVAVARLRVLFVS
jgi:hypothetical protein